MDTGMSGCGLPKSIIRKQLKLKFPTRGLTEDADGKFKERQAWMVRVELLNFESGALEHGCGKLKVFTLGDEAHPIVGRNVLNQFVVTLNGPELMCEIK